MTTPFEVQIRKGVEVCDDPQRRYYNGCWAKSHWEWGEWRHFTDAKDEEFAKATVQGFQRGDQQLRIIEKELA